MSEHLIVDRWQEDGKYWVRCPVCGTPGQVDEDQFEGDVSIIHEDDGFHGTFPKGESRWAPG